VYKGVQTLGTKLSWQLHFIWWHLIFVGHQYGTCWYLEFWSGFKISGNCVHPRLHKFTVYKSHGIQYFCTSALSCCSYNDFLPFYITAVYMIYILITYQFWVKPMLYLYTVLSHIHKDHWKIIDFYIHVLIMILLKLSFHCTCTQNMCGNHSER